MSLLLTSPCLDPIPSPDDLVSLLQSRIDSAGEQHTRRKRSQSPLQYDAFADVYLSDTGRTAVCPPKEVEKLRQHITKLKELKEAQSLTPVRDH